MPSETEVTNQSILTCQNGIDFRLVLVCLIDLDRVTMEELIIKENIPCSYMTVRSKIPNERRKAEKRRTACLKKISGLLPLGA